MLPTLAAIADLVAAAGVIGSLRFLALQLREPKRRFMPATAARIDGILSGDLAPIGAHR
ncbi:hypothetical protein KUL25_10405 [Rhodobacteraceae bacterium N5(2021)]|uniref:Uncharacterized protein n=1 Tax=Gymnodinialimonas phycosphaerae TaxID=2841589 RepID=A0A975YHS5_9RHOB|nr:hypothetical protein [Gymnodinialimonas phycosphaerae]MBY4893176.1 hypothetical protein [Gymnodinialimonas phycosphaerae]